MAGENEWTEDELKAAVGAYLEMLRLEQTGAEYSKTEFRRQLRANSIPNRTDSSIEFRMQNISSVLESMGRPRIAGYRPAGNVGPTSEPRIRSFIEKLSPPARTLPATTVSDIVGGVDKVMGVKAVFGPLHSHVLCFSGRTPGKASYFSVAAGVARRAVDRPFIFAIGGGPRVRDNLGGCVLNIARASTVYGLTERFVVDPAEIERLEQWPVAIALHDVYRIVGYPHLVDELGFDDRLILAGAQDGVIRPDDKVEQLWAALSHWPIERIALPLPHNFYDTGSPSLATTELPTFTGKEEGEKIWKLQRKIERDATVSRAAKRLNIAKYGRLTCEACTFAHDDSGLFDAHHPTPLAIGKRTTLPEHLHILCPTCHRRAHRKSPLDPYSLLELQSWITAGRP